MLRSARSISESASASGSRSGSAAPRHVDLRVQRVIDFFEGLRQEDLPRLAECYVDDASFKDPFNEVRGCVAILQVFDHMFTALRQPQFVVHDAVQQGDQAFLTWDFHFRLPQAPDRVLTIRGATQLHFAADGRIDRHRDWWDAAEELYEKLPIVGALMRWLKRRIAR
jgi:steroid Delta-isomerase